MRLAVAVAATMMACGTTAKDEGGRAERTLIQNKGSDTLVNVAQAWAEAYRGIDPNTAVAVTGGGSGTGISSMINGTVDIANASRKMKTKELEAAQANGVDPKEHVVGHDALAVYLHPDNPITELTLGQLAQIYGEGGTIETWSQLGVTIPSCSSDEIIRISRQNNSGTYAYFRSAVLGKTGEYKLGSRDMHGSKDVVDLVEKTPCAIGYSGLAYATDHIETPCVKSEDDGMCIAPSAATASDGTYPIARPLLMYTAGTPTGAVAAYLDWILSDPGQCIIAAKGYAPIRAVSCD